MFNDLFSFKVALSLMYKVVIIHLSCPIIKELMMFQESTGKLFVIFLSKCMLFQILYLVIQAICFAKWNQHRGLCPALSQRLGGDECFMGGCLIITGGRVQEGTIGRVQRRLEEFGSVRGLVVGVYSLLRDLANSRLKAVGLQ